MNIYQENAQGGIEALQKWYDPSRGLWHGTGWWNAAHALWVIIDYSARTQTRTYESVVKWTFERNRAGKFLNNFYDDEGWWALTWIKAFDVFGDPAYLAMARTVFADMEGGWDTACHGGIWWKKERRYKNAVSNELFFALAAKLYLRVGPGAGNRSYLDWAEEAWGWFELSGMINAQNLVNDGLNDQCQNNGGETWTYNQGVLLGGLADMYHITQDRAYLKRAQSIANATITTLVDQAGILREPCEPAGCGADGTQFKGIFVRSLAYLNEAEPDGAYKLFILKNATAIIQQNRTRDYQFGLLWAGPVDSADASRQSSALDALNAAITLADEARSPPG
ncbi:MAG: hypothetical protein PVSMB5_38230 [Ktedonobacteraceae bacterium]